MERSKTMASAESTFPVSDSAPFNWKVLFLALLAQTASTMSSQAIAPLAPFMKADLNLSLAQIGIFTASMRGGATLTLFQSGRMTDRFGARTVTAVGIAVVGSFLVLSGLAPTYLLILAAFVCCGAASGFGSPALTVVIQQWFSPRARGTAMSVKQSGLPVGGIIVANLAPVLLLFLPWRGALMGIGVVIIACGAVFYAGYRNHPSESLNVQRAPIARSSYIRRNLILLSTTAALFVAAQNSINVYWILYLTKEAHQTLLAAGSLLSIVFFGSAFGRIGAGVISDRFYRGRRRAPMMVLGFATAATGFIVALTGHQLPYLGLAVASALFGLCGQGWNGLYFTMLAEISNPEALATTVGFSMTIQQMGSIIGTPLVGGVADLTGGYWSVWVAVAVLALLGALLLLTVQEKKRGSAVRSP